LLMALPHHSARYDTLEFYGHTGGMGDAAWPAVYYN
jgi:hypothetical protein